MINKRILALGLILILTILTLVGISCGPLWVPEEPVARSSADYGWLKQEQFTVVATGAAGSAGGSKNSDGPLRGHLYGVHLDFASTISNTTDFTLTVSNDPSLTVLDLNNHYTDTWLYPAVQQTDSAGSGTSTYDRLPLNDWLTAEISQSTATYVVTVTVLWGK